MRPALRVTCFFVAMAVSALGHAQAFLESQPIGTSRDGVLVLYGSDATATNKRIPYERISGSPFWKDEFLMATLISKDNQVLTKAPVKLNLYTNEVYFKNAAGEVRVPNKGLVTKILFYGTDTSRQVMAVFENNLPNIAETNPNAENPSYVQVMNNGEVQLLKYIKMQFITADSLFGTMKRYYFSDRVFYFLNTKYGQTFKLKKLNIESVTDQLNLDSGEREWIRKNQLSLKKEEEVVEFLNYLNAFRKSRS